MNKTPSWDVEECFTGRSCSQISAKAPRKRCRSRGSLALLLFVSIVHAALAQGTVEIEVNATPDLGDDYICWSPVQGRMRLVGGTADVPVTLSSKVREAGQLNGEVWFAPFSINRPTSAQFNPTDTLAVTLPQNGAWKSFWVAGKTASTDGKDTAIIASNAAGQELSRTTLMVRIRKNAQSLKPIEIERFLQAVATLHDVEHNGQNSKYLKYVKVHADAFFSGIHRVPAFPPWHRTMLLSFERELQTIDARVALPYWKFDENAPDLFVPGFMGQVQGFSTRVTFSTGHPLANWRMPSDAAIASWQMGTPPPQSTEEMVRSDNGGSSHPDVSFTAVSNRTRFSIMWDRLEGRYHDDAHIHIAGWMGSIQSPKDPLFFLLHANVDRAWAQWQKDKNLIGETDPNSYSPQGSFPGSSAVNHQGSYAEDTQWPWNLSGGNQGTPTTGDDWPQFVFPLPPSPENHGPSAKPTTRESIDYQDVDGSGLPHNYSYDKIMFKN